MRLKKTIAFMLCNHLVMFAAAQGLGIGTNPPHASSILELKKYK